MEPRGRRRATSSSVFGCLTESPLMLNVMLPGQPLPVACFVKTKKMNINVIQSERCGRERGGLRSKGGHRRYLDLLNRVCSGGSNAAAKARSINMQSAGDPLLPCVD